MDSYYWNGLTGGPPAFEVGKHNIVGRDLNGNIQHAHDIGNSATNNNWPKSCDYDSCERHEIVHAKGLADVGKAETKRFPPLLISEAKCVFTQDEEEDDDKTPEYPLKDGSFLSFFSSGPWLLAEAKATAGESFTEMTLSDGHESFAQTYDGRQIKRNDLQTIVLSTKKSTLAKPRARSRRSRGRKGPRKNVTKRVEAKKAPTAVLFLKSQTDCLQPGDSPVVHNYYSLEAKDSEAQGNGSSDDESCSKEAVSGERLSPMGELNNNMDMYKDTMFLPHPLTLYLMCEDGESLSGNSESSPGTDPVHIFQDLSARKSPTSFRQSIDDGGQNSEAMESKNHTGINDAAAALGKENKTAVSASPKVLLLHSLDSLEKPSKTPGRTNTKPTKYLPQCRDLEPYTENVHWPEKVNATMMSTSKISDIDKTKSPNNGPVAIGNSSTSNLHEARDEILRIDKSLREPSQAKISRQGLFSEKAPKRSPKTLARKRQPSSSKSKDIKSGNHRADGGSQTVELLKVKAPALLKKKPGDKTEKASKANKNEATDAMVVSRTQESNPAKAIHPQQKHSQRSVVLDDQSNKLPRHDISPLSMPTPSFSKVYSRQESCPKMIPVSSPDICCNDALTKRQSNGYERPNPEKRLLTNASLPEYSTSCTGTGLSGMPFSARPGTLGKDLHFDEVPEDIVLQPSDVENNQNTVLSHSSVTENTTKSIDSRLTAPKTSEKPRESQLKTSESLESPMLSRVKRLVLTEKTVASNLKLAADMEKATIASRAKTPEITEKPIASNFMSSEITEKPAASYIMSTKITNKPLTSNLMSTKITDKTVTSNLMSTKITNKPVIPNLMSTKITDKHVIANLTTTKIIDKPEMSYLEKSMNNEESFMANLNTLEITAKSVRSNVKTTAEVPQKPEASHLKAAELTYNLVVPAMKASQITENQVVLETTEMTEDNPDLSSSVKTSAVSTVKTTELAENPVPSNEKAPLVEKITMPPTSVREVTEKATKTWQGQTGVQVKQRSVTEGTESQVISHSSEVVQNSSISHIVATEITEKSVISKHSAAEALEKPIITEEESTQVTEKKVLSVTLLGSPKDESSLVSKLFSKNLQDSRNFGNKSNSLERTAVILPHKRQNSIKSRIMSPKKCWSSDYYKNSELHDNFSGMTVPYLEHSIFDDDVTPCACDPQQTGQNISPHATMYCGVESDAESCDNGDKSALKRGGNKTLLPKVDKMQNQNSLKSTPLVSSAMAEQPISSSNLSPHTEHFTFRHKDTVLPPGLSTVDSRNTVHTIQMTMTCSQKSVAQVSSLDSPVNLNPDQSTDNIRYRRAEQYLARTYNPSVSICDKLRETSVARIKEAFNKPRQSTQDFHQMFRDDCPPNPHIPRPSESIYCAGSGQVERNFGHPFLSETTDWRMRPSEENRGVVGAVPSWTAPPELIHIPSHSHVTSYLPDYQSRMRTRPSHVPVDKSANTRNAGLPYPQPGAVNGPPWISPFPTRLDELSTNFHYSNYQLPGTEALQFTNNSLQPNSNHLREHFSRLNMHKPQDWNLLMSLQAAPRARQVHQMEESGRYLDQCYPAWVKVPTRLSSNHTQMPSSITGSTKHDTPVICSQSSDPPNAVRERQPHIISEIIEMPPLLMSAKEPERLCLGQSHDDRATPTRDFLGAESAFSPRSVCQDRGGLLAEGRGRLNKGSLNEISVSEPLDLSQHANHGAENYHINRLCLGKTVERAPDPTGNQREGFLSQPPTKLIQVEPLSSKIVSFSESTHVQKDLLTFAASNEEGLSSPLSLRPSRLNCPETAHQASPQAQTSLQADSLEASPSNQVDLVRDCGHIQEPVIQDRLPNLVNGEETYSTVLRQKTSEAQKQSVVLNEKSHTEQHEMEATNSINSFQNDSPSTLPSTQRSITSPKLRTLSLLEELSRDTEPYCKNSSNKGQHTKKSISKQFLRHDTKLKHAPTSVLRNNVVEQFSKSTGTPPVPSANCARDHESHKQNALASERSVSLDGPHFGSMSDKCAEELRVATSTISSFPSNTCVHPDSLIQRAESIDSNVSSASGDSQQIPHESAEIEEIFLSKVVGLPVKDFFTDNPKENAYSSLLLAKLTAENRKAKEKYLSMEEPFIFSRPPKRRREVHIEVNNELQRDLVIDLTKGDDECVVVSMISPETVQDDDRSILNEPPGDGVASAARTSARTSDAIEVLDTRRLLSAELFYEVSDVDNNMDDFDDSGCENVSISTVSTCADKYDNQLSITCAESETNAVSLGFKRIDLSNSEPIEGDRQHRVSGTSDFFLPDNCRDTECPITQSKNEDKKSDGPLKDATYASDLKVSNAGKEIVVKKFKQAMASRVSINDLNLDCTRTNTYDSSVEQSSDSGLGQSSDSNLGQSAYSTVGQSADSSVGQSSDSNVGQSSPHCSNVGDGENEKCENSTQRAAAALLELSVNPLYNSFALIPETSNLYQEKFYQMHPTLDDEPADHDMTRYCSTSLSYNSNRQEKGAPKIARRVGRPPKNQAKPVGESITNPVETNSINVTGSSTCLLEHATTSSVTLPSVKRESHNLLKSQSARAQNSPEPLRSPSSHFFNPNLPARFNSRSLLDCAQSKGLATPEPLPSIFTSQMPMPKNTADCPWYLPAPDEFAPEIVEWKATRLKPHSLSKTELFRDSVSAIPEKEASRTHSLASAPKKSGRKRKDIVANDQSATIATHVTAAPRSHTVAKLLRSKLVRHANSKSVCSPLGKKRKYQEDSCVPMQPLSTPTVDYYTEARRPNLMPSRENSSMAATRAESPALLVRTPNAELRCPLSGENHCHSAALNETQSAIKRHKGDFRFCANSIEMHDLGKTVAYTMQSNRKDKKSVLNKTSDHNSFVIGSLQQEATVGQIMNADTGKYSQLRDGQSENFEHQYDPPSLAQALVSQPGEYSDITPDFGLASDSGHLAASGRLSRMQTDLEREKEKEIASMLALMMQNRRLQNRRVL